MKPGYKIIHDMFNNSMGVRGLYLIVSNYHKNNNIAMFERIEKPLKDDYRIGFWKLKTLKK